MKKITCVFLTLIAVVLCFSSCMKSAEVRAVEEKIAAIGEISLEKESLILEAEDSYTKLPQKDKKKVFFKPLELARKNLELLKEFNRDAGSVLELINKSLSEYGTKKDEITESYNALTDSLSACDAQLKAEYEKIFEPVRTKYAEYEKIEADAAISAKVYIDYFRGINTDKKITVTDIGCIAQISEGTVYYLFAFTYTDGKNEESVYSTVRFAGTPGKESFRAFEKNFYSDAPSSENADALIMGNVEILPGSVN